VMGCDALYCGSVAQCSAVTTLLIHKAYTTLSAAPPTPGHGAILTKGHGATLTKGQGFVQLQLDQTIHGVHHCTAPDKFL
jgi:transcriptional regulator of nitric oxide reductase